MKLNAAEKFLMNNPLFTALQRRREAPLLAQFGGRLAGGRALEIGCGRGIGTELIFRRFGAREVHAFDPDPDMVIQARKRLGGYPAGCLDPHVADATAIPKPAASFDAVFDFGVVHPVPDLETALTMAGRRSVSLATS